MKRKGMIALCILVLGMVLLFAMTVAASAADVGIYAYAADAPSYTVSIANTNYCVAGGGILHITRQRLTLCGLASIKPCTSMILL